MQIQSLICGLSNIADSMFVNADVVWIISEQMRRSVGEQRVKTSAKRTTPLEQTTPCKQTKMNRILSTMNSMSLMAIGLVFTLFASLKVGLL